MAALTPGAALVQSNSGNTGTTAPSSVTVTLPAVTSADNRLVLCIVSDSTVATPAGWLLEESQVQFAGQYVFRKRGDGGQSWVIPTAAVSTSWVILELSGIHWVDPVAAVVSAGSVSGVTVRSTGVTDETVAAVGGIAVASWATTKPGTSAIATLDGYTNSFTEVADTSTTRTVSGVNVGIAVATLAVTADAAFESTATISDNAVTTAILIVYRTHAS